MPDTYPCQRLDRGGGEGRSEGLPSFPGPLFPPLLLGGSRAGPAALGSLSAVVLARGLSPEALGWWSLTLAVQGYALHLGEVGLRSVVTAAAARTPGRFGRLLLRYLGLRLAISLTLVLAIGAAGWLYAPDI